MNAKTKAKTEITPVQIPEEAKEAVDRLIAAEKQKKKDKTVFEISESAAKTAAQQFYLAVPEINKVPGSAGIAVVDSDGAIVLKLTKARAVNTTDLPVFLSLVMEASGVDTSLIQIIHSTFESAGIYNLISLQTTKAQEMVPTQYEIATKSEDIGSRTISVV